jgi:polyketide biosynthesis enoyl-CoA hydratase PksI
MSVADPFTIEHGDLGVSVLRMDDGQANGMSESFCEGMERALASANTASCNVLVLRGRPDVFCSGATQETLEALSSGKFRVRDLALASLLIAFPLPIIAAVEGPAVGGGLMLALCADIVVAAEKSRYGFNFVDLGFTPGMGATEIVPALVGRAFATEMLMTGKLYRSEELRSRGMFNHILPAESVFPAAKEIAERIAVKPRHVLELLKDTLAVPRRAALQSALAREHLLHQICFNDNNASARIRAAFVPNANPVERHS